MRLSSFGELVFSSLFVISCGPGKELKSTQARADSLGNTVSQLNVQVVRLTGQIEQLNGSLLESNAEVSRLKNINAVAMQEVSDCKLAKEAVARRMEELNQAVTADGISMREVQRKTAVALAQFADAGVDVTYKNGLVYISIQDELLFSPGTAKLGKNSQQVLAVVAQVLNDNPNLKIYVICYTDSIKVTRGFPDNWSFSTERANSVVRVLRDQYQVTMDRMTSAGRAGNRRTDIILNPDWSRLWDLINKQQ